MVPTPTRRRTLRLMSSVSLVGLAGCVEAVPGFGEDGTAGPKLTFSADVLRSFSDAHPGRIRIELTNETDQALAMGITHGIEGPLSTIEGERTDGDEQLVLLGEPSNQPRKTPPGAPCDSAQYAIPDTPTDGCWQPACDYKELTSHYTITIQAGQTLSWPYVVLDGFNDQCLPAGTYVFEETAPITFGEFGDTPVPTPPGGYAEQINKRVELTLASDGTLSAVAHLQPAS